MRTHSSSRNPRPVNQNPDLHDWDLDIHSLRLESFTPTRILQREEDADTIVFALSDDWGRIYPRECALETIEQLMAFYNSITDEQIDEYNCEIEGEEGAKAALRMRLDQTLLRIVWPRASLYPPGLDKRDEHC